MFRMKKAGLVGRIVVLLLLIYLVVTLVSVRQKISTAKDEIETLNQQVSEQLQHNTELSNAIENRDNPTFLQDIAREKLGLVSPRDRVFYITD